MLKAKATKKQYAWRRFQRSDARPASISPRLAELR